MVDGGPVHQVALGEPAGRARRPPRRFLDLGNARSDALGHGLDDELLAPRGGERLALGLGLDRVVEDAEIEVETGRLVSRLDQHVPERQRVLAAGHRHEDGLVGREHLVLADGLGDLLAEELLEVRRAERGVVPRQLDDGARSALAALHWSPGAPARHHRTHLEQVAVAHDLVGRQEVGAADHEHGARQDVELAEDVLDAPAPGQLDLAARVAEPDLHGSIIAHRAGT